MADRPFALSGKEYWSDPQKNLDGLADKQMQGMIEDIVVDVPEEIDISEYRTLPMLAFQSGKTDELFKAPFEDVAVATAINPDEGVLLTARAVTRLGPKEPPGPPPEPGGFVGNFHQIELASILGIPWRPSRYLVSIIIRDKVSNRLTVDLVGPKSAFEDVEVTKFLAARRKKQPPREISPPPGSPLVQYGKQEGSIDIPAKPGITLKVDRVVVGELGARAVMHGSFRLPVRPTDVLRPAADKDKDGRALPTAVVPISLLVIGSEDTAPWTVPMIVPSYDDVAGSPDSPIATGWFQIDMLKDGRIATRPQTFFIYGFAGMEMTAPTIMAVISPKTLKEQK